MPQIRAQANKELAKRGGPALVKIEAEERVFASYDSKLDPLIERLRKLDKDLGGAARMSTEKLRDLVKRY